MHENTLKDLKEVENIQQYDIFHLFQLKTWIFESDKKGMSAGMSGGGMGA